MAALYDYRITDASGYTTFALDDAYVSLHQSGMQTADDLLARLKAAKVTQDEMACVLNVKQPNVAKLYNPDARTGKKRNLTWDEGWQLIEQFGGRIGHLAGADTPPPAWIPKQTTVVRILEVFGPYAWANLNDEGSLREVADAIASVFGTISNDRAIEDNPDELSGALKSAAYSLRGLPQAPRPSKPSTQRHKSDNS